MNDPAYGTRLGRDADTIAHRLAGDERLKCARADISESGYLTLTLLHDTGRFDCRRCDERIWEITKSFMCPH